MRRQYMIGAAVLVVAVVVAWLLWPVGDDREAAGGGSPAAGSGEPEPGPDEDPFAAFLEAAAREPLEPEEEEAELRRRWAERDEWSPEERRAWREKRRAERRERWARMSPEERRERLRRFVDIVPLGEEEPQLEPEDVMDALRGTRSQVRECMREHGGFRALREAMRDQRSASDGGLRGGLRVSFDVGADGTIAAEGIAIEPPPPEPFYDCFAGALTATQLPAPEAEARVELELGRRGGRRAPRRGDGEGATERADDGTPRERGTTVTVME